MEHSAGRFSPDIIRQEEVDRQTIELSRNAMQIEAYYARFPSERILLLAFEDLVRDPQSVVDTVCRFLGIDPGFSFRHLDKVRNTSRLDHPDYTWASRSTLLRTIWSVVPTRQRRSVRNRLATKPVNMMLSPRQQAYVLGELRDDLAKLGNDYGFDVSRWGIEP